MINLSQVLEEHPDVSVHLDFRKGHVTFVAEYYDARQSLAFAYSQLEQIELPELIEEAIDKLCRSVKTAMVREWLTQEAPNFKGTVFEEWIHKLAEREYIDLETARDYMDTIRYLANNNISEDSPYYRKIRRRIYGDG